MFAIREREREKERIKWPLYGNCLPIAGFKGQLVLNGARAENVCVEDGPSLLKRRAACFSWPCSELRSRQNTSKNCKPDPTSCRSGLRMCFLKESRGAPVGISPCFCYIPMPFTDLRSNGMDREKEIFGPPEGFNRISCTGQDAWRCRAHCIPERKAVFGFCTKPDDMWGCLIIQVTW